MTTSPLFRNLGMASGLSGLDSGPGDPDPTNPFSSNSAYALRPKPGSVMGPVRSEPLVPGGIPLPDYNDSKSRLKYAEAWRNKYGAYMQGRGDTPLRINEVPNTSTDKLTAKQASLKAVEKLGLDPALFYSSAMEEGMSGMFKKGYEGEGPFNSSSYEDFPVSGFAGIGLDHFGSAYPELVKKGYLPADFTKKFQPTVMTNEKGETTHSGDFRSVEDALSAKAAMAKLSEDQLTSFAKKSNIPLSEKAKQFFTYINYNAGEGNAQKMLMDYYKSGALKNDAFMNSRPISGGNLKEASWKQPYDNVMRRVKMADALMKEGYFDNPVAKKASPMASPMLAYAGQ